MGTHADWERDAIVSGTLRVPVAGYAGGAPPAVEDNGLEDMARFRREQNRQREIEAMQEEQEDERELKKLQREARRVQYLKAISAANGEESGSRDNLVRDLMMQFNEEKREMMAEMREIRNASANSMTSELAQRLGGLETALQQLQQPKTTDPLGELVRSAQAITAVRAAIDTALPPPVVSDAHASRREALEELRIQQEVDMRKLEHTANLEAAQAARLAAQNDRDVRMHRASVAGDMVKESLGPLVAAFVGDKVGGPASKALGALSGGPESGGPGGLRFVCPNPDCRQPGQAPGETDAHTCTHCGATFPLSRA